MKTNTEPLQPNKAPKPEIAVRAVGCKGLCEPSEIRTVSRAETIRELPNGWLNKHTGRTHKFASGAHSAVMRRSAAVANAPGIIVITVITWEPTTDAGRVIAKALSK